jgi:DNA-directed RNA polymerase subunit RPC12/RpoP
MLARSTPAEPAQPAPATPPNRTVLAQSEAMIRYTCPRCKKSLESPASFAGQKLNCPDCNQRLQIPQSSAPPATPPVNKTIVATETIPPASAPPPSYPQPAPPAAIPVARPPVQVELVERSQPLDRLEEMPPAQRENCLECGVDLARRSRVQTCPDCGSLFCSAACYREHTYHAHVHKAKVAKFVECRYCGSGARPYTTSAISQAGWITFAFLLILFFPLFWIGLLMTETQVNCADCGARLN